MSSQTFFGRIGLWEQQRWPWIVIAILSASLVLIAHNVFQVWLYMKPCEQCVYIRFAFLCMTFGCLFPIVFPKSLFKKAKDAIYKAYHKKGERWTAGSLGRPRRDVRDAGLLS